MDDDERDVADEGMGPDAEGSGKEGPDSDRTDQLEEDSSDSETVEVTNREWHAAPCRQSPRNAHTLPQPPWFHIPA